MFGAEPLPRSGPLAEHARARAALIARGLQRAGVTALLPGPGDMALGRDTFDALVRARALPVLASNLVRQGDRTPAYRTHIVASIGRTRVVVVGVVDPETWPPATGLVATPPLPALQQVLGRVVRAGDPVVLVVRGDADSAEILARQLPQVSAVLVAQRGLVSFFPRELVRPGQRPELDGSSVPLVAVGQQGHNLAQFDVWAVPRDATWRGGAVSEDARERRDLARRRLAAQPDDRAAQSELEEVEALLQRQAGKTRYRYHLLELDDRQPEDPEIARQRAALAD